MVNCVNYNTVAIFSTIYAHNRKTVCVYVTSPSFLVQVPASTASIFQAWVYSRGRPAPSALDTKSVGGKVLERCIAVRI